MANKATLGLSPILPPDLFNRQSAPAYPCYHSSGQLYWLEALTQEKGRLALVTRHAGQLRIITPPAYQIRTAVHEYGGKAFCIYQDTLYFNNYADGLIYAQVLPSAAQLANNTPPKVVPISQAIVGLVGMADLSIAADGSCLMGVLEYRGAKENHNCIAVVSLSDDTVRPPQIVVSGADFYACPCCAPDGKKLAWLQWNHPNMPWDSSAVYAADWAQTKAVYAAENPVQVDGDASAAVCQLGFLHDGALVYAKDQDAAADSPANYWNLHRWQHGNITPLTADTAEYGEAHWIFGQTRWLQLNADYLVAIRSLKTGDELVLLALTSPALASPAADGSVELIAGGFARLSHLTLANCGTKIAAVAQSVDRESALIEITLLDDKRGNERGNDKFSMRIRQSLPPILSKAAVALPEVVAFNTADGAQAYANYYPPNSPHAPPSSPPAAAIVRVHGGPTARADTSLSLLTQYFTSSGFAVIDVNHRGSTGLGRAYRQQLLGLWGQIDASDIIDAVQHFVALGKVDAAKVCIRGGSAGGYAVLRVLTEYPNSFCAGACYYGIGNLSTLCAITHKFESHYTDRLIGEAFNPQAAKLASSRYQTRSPIFHIDKIRSPLILFQGAADKIVPPAVSREMVQGLKNAKVPHEYIEYAGEGHGFRQAKTRIDALEKEMAFYKKVLNRDI